MQYGNFGLGILAKNPIIRFKSYYVVWKQRMWGHRMKSSYQFKSYYVVWKLLGERCDWCKCGCLNRTMQYGNLRDVVVFGTFTEFKSYYVVWKHKHRKNHADRETGLNRTMQYGNYFSFFCFSKANSCLNRTMQYGNYIRPPTKISHRQFKSYYVVWKL